MHSSHIEFEYTVNYSSAGREIEVSPPSPLYMQVELFSYPNFF
ncbi:hypothetical protein T06_2204 [Trichinella sp. T6]|nr:hypothetical protein T06_15077 [Trichinella sp. T6]KRX28955.1 hypothetical protein T06_2204 [Trichinella sp. T6]